MSLRYSLPFFTVLPIHALSPALRMALAALLSFAFCILFGPYFIRKLYEWKIGQPIRMEDCPLLGQLHSSKKDTPTMGGILILAAVVFSALISMDWHCSFTWILLFTACSFGAVGAFDDYLKLRHRSSKGLRARGKMLLKILLSSALIAYWLIPAVSLPFDQIFNFSPVEILSTDRGAQLAQFEYMRALFFPLKEGYLLLFKGAGLVSLAIFYVFVIVGSSNAVNLTDGLDGLAAGSIAITAASFALIAWMSCQAEIAFSCKLLYIAHSAEIAVCLSAVFGACLGFFWFNAHPAQCFMGDTGSLSLGAILGVSAILLRQELLLALIGGLFVLEALSVIIQVGSFRLRKGRRVFLCSPLHHHFEYKGWPETKIVARFWVVSLLFAFLGLILLAL